MSEFIAKTLRDIDERLRALQPFVDEFERLQAAQRALDDAAGPAAGPSGTGHRRRRRRPDAASSGWIEVLASDPSTRPAGVGDGRTWYAQIAGLSD